MKNISLFLSLLGVGTGVMPVLAQNNQPNIIVLLSDDQGWGDLGFTGNNFVKTPNIDRIAHEGAILDNFYVCPVSSPTRAEFLTGRYHVRTGVSSTSSGGERFNLGEKTIAEFFKEGGYSTSLFGKWHSGTQYPYHPNARGFEEFFGFCSGHWGNYWNPILEHNGEIVYENGFIADILTDKAIDYIKAHKENPFFLYLAYNTPHSPMQMPDSWWNGVKDRSLTQKATRPMEEDTIFTKAALALAENLDWNIGRLMALLEKLDLEKETILIYFSDNGPNSFRWNGGMKGRKGSTDEGGVRSPFCIRWPGHIKAGSVIPQLSGVVDLLPTLLSMANVEYTPYKELDGINIEDQLLKENIHEQDRTLYSYWGRKISVRIPGYVLDNQGKLYNIRNDREQIQDLSVKESKIHERMQKSLDKFKQEVLSDFSYNDVRPFVIGHPDEIFSKLPARDAKIFGAIERSNRYPNCSYFTNWKSTDANINWNVEVAESGLFEVRVYYTCDQRNIGSSFELSSDREGERLNFTLNKVNDNPMIGADLDRSPRAESYFKGFRPVSVGNISISKGKTNISLKATDIANQEAMNFWLLEFKRVK